MTQQTQASPTAEQQTDTDVVIVGGGMTGGLLAILLAEQGLAVTVLDGAPAPEAVHGDAQLRVSTLTEASMWQLKNSGVWPLIDHARVQPYSAMHVWDDDGTGEVLFDAHTLGLECLGWLLENANLTAALFARAQQLPNLTWHCNTAVTGMRRNDTHWQVNGADATWRASLLVGADGAQSQVRDWAGISGAPQESGHHALVATLQCEQGHDACARQAFLESGPLALLPLFSADEKGGQVSIVWSGWPERIVELNALSDDAFAQQVQAASGGALGAMRLQSPRAVFPIQERHAGSYIAPGLALVGDAAHVIHPLAGQGVNLGLLDAGVLAEEIARAVAQGRGVADAAALARYQRRRRGENLLMQNAMRGFKALFERRELPLRWLRNAGMRWFNRAEPLKQHVIAQALGRVGDVPDNAKPRSPS